MKTELEKCSPGEWYDCHAPVSMGSKRETHGLLLKYNSLSYDCKEKEYALLKEMFGSIGKKASIRHSLICGYGCNISIGNNVNINTGCTFVDCNKIIIGNNVLITPGVQIYMVTHPAGLNGRLVPIGTEDETAYIHHTHALPVTIEDDCQTGGGIIILPGATVGQGNVIGAGSVITKSVPTNGLAVGDPCKIIREVDTPVQP